MLTVTPRVAPILYSSRGIVLPNGTIAPCCISVISNGVPSTVTVESLLGLPGRFLVPARPACFSI